jgi:hypothetical protein
VVLHKQERYLAADTADGQTYAQACYLPLAADAYVLAFRDWVQRCAGGGPAWPRGVSAELPPAIPTREALLERYSSHTRNCTSCLAALRGVQAARAALLVLGAVAALVASGGMSVAAALGGSPAARGALNAAAAGLGTAVLSLFAWLRLAKTERGFMVGDWPPPRNRPAKKKLITRGPKNSGQSVKLV